MKEQQRVLRLARIKKEQLGALFRQRRRRSWGVALVKTKEQPRASRLAKRKEQLRVLRKRR
jgi:hypothetical protein